MRAIRVGSVALLLSCAPQPSSVPLGGKEWVRPEPHVDRRAPSTGEAPRRAAPKKAAAPAVVAEVPTVTPPTPVVPIAPLPQEGLRFETRPVAVGNTVELQSRITARLALPAALPGMDGDGSAELLVEQRLKVTVAEVRDAQLRAVDVEYLESRVRLLASEAANAEDSARGKRYRVTLTGGVARVVSQAGPLDPNEGERVLFDLATVTGYAPLVTPRLPATLPSGWKTRVDATTLTPVLGAGHPIRLEQVTLALIGGEPGKPDIGRFDCGLGAHLKQDGMDVAVNLSGTCSVRRRDSRPVEIRLSGTLAAIAASPLGGDANLSGTAELWLQHTYSP